jgi:type II secretory pathway component GspD/PulD (secretin)
MKAPNVFILGIGLAWGLILTAAAQPSDPPREEPAPPAQEDSAAPQPAPADAQNQNPDPNPNPSQDSAAPAPAQPDAPADSEPAPAAGEPAPPVDSTPPAESPRAQDARPNPPPQAPAKTTSPPVAEPVPDTPPAETTPASPAGQGERGLRLNFRGAPLELVLNYLSEAAGFIIVPEADIKGKVDVWSNQTLTRDEAVDVLNAVLSKNGYAVLRNDRTLKIVTKEEARKSDIPVKTGNDPVNIPKTDDMVTQIIPVRFVNAVQLSRDLTPLMPPQATVVANEGGNAILITDTQVNIRRMAEIIKALDTSIASVSVVKVFPLQYADAKALATSIRDLFQSQDSSRGAQAGGANPMQQFFRGMRGGPGGAGGAPGGGGSSAGSGGGRVSMPRVVAVADERSNSVVVSAPEDQMPIIEDLVKQVDTPVEDITELRVFRLKYADPQETADLLTSLFPDTTTTQGGRGQIRFGGGPFGGGRMGGGTSTDSSSRMLKQSRVLAVPDLRTSSIVVSASRDLLDQIARMIEQLDADPAKKQKVFVYSVENTDPAAVEEILRGLFESQNSRNSGTSSRNNSNRQTGNQLNNRATSRQNQTGNSGFGGGSGFGGTGTRTGSGFGQ